MTGSSSLSTHRARLVANIDLASSSCVLHSSHMASSIRSFSCKERKNTTATAMLLSQRTLPQASHNAVQVDLSITFPPFLFRVNYKKVENSLVKCNMEGSAIYRQCTRTII